MNIPNQRQMWEQKFGDGEHDAYRDVPSDFAQVAIGLIPAGSNVLELGCGVGVDADFFAQNGHNVLATDFSNVVIEQNKAKYSEPNLKFEVVDLEARLPYEPGRFDVIFAQLSLHYWTPDVTAEIIERLHSVLRVSGLLLFSCKATDDYYFGDGKEVEHNFFISNKGHVRHFFDEEYTRNLLGDKFEVLSLEKVTEDQYGVMSSVLRCVAKKVK